MQQLSRGSLECARGCLFVCCIPSLVLRGMADTCDDRRDTDAQSRKRGISATTERDRKGGSEPNSSDALITYAGRELRRRLVSIPSSPSAIAVRRKHAPAQ